MSRGRMVSMVLLAAAAGFGTAWWLGSGDAPNEPQGPRAREILYWVAPMDRSYRSDQPGKSPMGMDLVPVYADDEAAGDTAEPALRIDPAVINNIGVKTGVVQRGTLHRTVNTVGYVTPDDDRVAHVHVRTEGWIERLHTATEGDAVSRGDLLFEIYSPALVSAQDEYLQARRSESSRLLEAAAQRLRALGMSAEQIRQIGERGRAQQLIAVESPQDGYLMELNVREGMFVEPGTTIMSLADLSEIWVEVDVFERQIDSVEAGQPARMRLPFAPDRIWQGSVDYVYPTIRSDSRTARVRLAFSNPDLALKPNMYANVQIDVDPRDGVLFVPSQAVIRTGSGSRVIVALDGGRFRPAQVEAGLESGGRTEIVRGLAEGERVVVSSQFLIDSEASLDASLLRMIDETPGPSSGGHDMNDMRTMDDSQSDPDTRSMNGDGGEAS